jgi:integrase
LTGFKKGRAQYGPVKTKKLRILTVPAYVVDAMELHLKEFVEDESLDALLFPSQDGKPFRRQTVNEAWRKALKKVGVAEGTRMHDLRHTNNTAAANVPGPTARRPWPASATPATGPTAGTCTPSRRPMSSSPTGSTRTSSST